MKRNYKRFLIIGICLVNTILVNAISFPSEAMGRPRIFDQMDKSYRWEDVAKNRNFSDLTDNAWTVYVINEGCKAYETPSSSGREVPCDLRFMEDCYVADISGDYALLFYYDKRLKRLEIPAEATKKVSTPTSHGRKNGYVGWVHLNDLLLWNVCPQTKDGIFKKIAVVKDVDALTQTNVNSLPELFVNSKCNKSASNPNYVNALDFYYAFQKNEEGNVLVYRNYQLEGNMRFDVAGWLEYGQYIDWNTRICWEPAFDGAINDYAYTFKSEDAAYDYDLSEKRSSTALSNKRKGPTLPRSPILSFENQVAKLSVLASATNVDVDIERTIKEIEKLERSMSQINVVFVMDATNSMRSCFSAMSKAVLDITKYKYLNNNVRFGVVVYRNYADERKGGLIDKPCPLTNVKENGEKIAQYLESINCYSASLEAQEAMFYGLTYAADNMDWSPDNSNFIILISDVTSKDPDRKGLTSAKVVQKLADKKINLVAFQARSYPESAYQNFSSQVGDIISDLLTKLGYGHSVIETNAKTGISMYSQGNGKKTWPLRPMAFKFKRSSDKSINPVELENLAEEMIKEFIAETTQNIGILKGRIGKNGQTEIDQSVCEELIKRRIIRKCEDLNGIIKVAGYSTRYSTSTKKEMFTSCVFLADKELTTLIGDLEKVTRANVKNRRIELQSAAKKLILSYTGQKFNASTIDNNFDKIVKEIETECGYSFYNDIKNHIANPNELDDADIDIIVNRLRNSISRLKEVQNDASNYKSQDGFKYYYVLLDDMPFVKDRH